VVPVKPLEACTEEKEEKSSVAVSQGLALLALGAKDIGGEREVCVCVCVCS
jgi:hypothetical protein